MKASVIVLSWNGKGYLKACLDAVFDQQYPDIEVIVVDNGSSDGSADFVETTYPAARVVRLVENTGFAAGNNVGLRAATGEALVLLNQDTQVHPGWLAALLEPLDDPGVGFVGCKMLYPDGTLQHAGGYLSDARGSPLHYGWHEPDHGQYDEPQEVPYVAGAAIALRRDTLVRIGPLDEGFHPAYFEDAEWCFRARAAGLAVLYWPAATLLHFESPGSDVGSYRQKAVYHHGRLRLLFKHQPIDWLQHEFAPAEAAWVGALGRTTEMQAARDAYLRLLLELPELFAYRTGPLGPAAGSVASGAPESEWSALLSLVTRLRDLTVGVRPSSPESGTGAQPPAPVDVALSTLLRDLGRQWSVEEMPFDSEMPVLGKTIAGFREAWNNVSTRWYVLPLLQQQVAFNATVRDALMIIFDELAQTQREVTRIAVALSGMQRQDSEDEDAPSVEGAMSDPDTSATRMSGKHSQPPHTETPSGPKPEET